MPQPPAASGPAGSPLGRYLLHPGQETAAFFHHVLHVLHVLAVLGHVAVPIAGGVGALLVAWKVLQAFGRLRAPTSGHLVEVELPPVVDPKGSARPRESRRRHPRLRRRENRRESPDPAS